MKRYTCVIATLGAALLASPAASQTASVPVTVGYAGLLTEDGVPVDRSVTLEVGLYTSPTPLEGESPVWSETHEVRARSGAFALSLGANEPLTLEALEASPLYLQITIGGGTTGPRQLLDAEPFARLAEQSVESGYPDGVYVGERQIIDANGFWTGEGSETLESLGCSTDQAPFRGSERWACLNVGDDASFATAGERCDEGSVMFGVSSSGSPSCVDLSNLVTQTDLVTDGYLTDVLLETLMLFGPDNAPSWTDLDGLPTGFLDGTDAVTSWSGQFPVEVNGTTVRLSGTGCDPGDWLVWNGSWACAAPPSNVSCQVEQAAMPAGATSTVTVNCPPNTTLTGGGFMMSDEAGADFNWNNASSFPSGSTSFTCDKNVQLTAGTCYAVCCS